MVKIENLSNEIEMTAVRGGGNIAGVGGTTLGDNGGGFEFASPHINVVTGAIVTQVDTTTLLQTITSIKNATMIGSGYAAQVL